MKEKFKKTFTLHEMVLAGAFLLIFLIGAFSNEIFYLLGISCLYFNKCQKWELWLWV